jgi:hypothetical protein
MSLFFGHHHLVSIDQLYGTTMQHNYLFCVC